MPGTRVRAVVEWAARFPTMANHTATHLLHAALREVLGDHVKQAGSAVRPDKLRFDFSHPAPLTAEERERVERLVNEKVFEAIPVRTFVTTIDEARQLGATMLFGEKYGSEVRVVEIDGFSRELCGGTHVRSTAEIGPFVILGESSVGAGARRIEAVTAGEAWAFLHGRSRELDATLRGARRDPPRGEAEADRRGAEAAEPTPEAELVGGVNVIVQLVEGLDADALLDLSDRFKQRQRAGRGRARLARRTATSTSSRTSTSRSPPGSRPATSSRRSRRSSAAAAAAARRWPAPVARSPRSSPTPSPVRASCSPPRSRKPMKVLALDYGSARTGIAVSDPTGTVARPLGVAERVGSPDGFARLLARIRAEQPERVVVGLPLTLRGARGRAGARDASLRRRRCARRRDPCRHLRRALHLLARRRRRRPRRGLPALQLPRMARAARLSRRLRRRRIAASVLFVAAVAVAAGVSIAAVRRQHSPAGRGATRRRRRARSGSSSPRGSRGLQMAVRVRDVARIAEPSAASAFA